MIKVAINGFGRIGRLAFIKIFEDNEFEVVAINDLTEPTMLAHLLKYDTVQKRYKEHSVEARVDSIVVDGKEIKIYKEADPINVPWRELGVDVVLECGKLISSNEELSKYIDSGVKKVIALSPLNNKKEKVLSKSLFERI